MPTILTVDKGKTVLAACDFVNDIIHPAGKFAVWGFHDEVERRNVIPNAKKLLVAVRAVGIRVIHVKVAFRPGMAGISQDAPLWKAAALIEGSWAPSSMTTSSPNRARS
jgi:nicotinamidase-related amidase